MKANKSIGFEGINHQKQDSRNGTHQVGERACDIGGKTGSSRRHRGGHGAWHRTWSGNGAGPGHCPGRRTGCSYPLASSTRCASRTPIGQTASAGLAKAHRLLSLALLWQGAGNTCSCHGQAVYTMEGSLSRFLCNRITPDNVVTHQLTQITSKRSDPKTPKRARSLFRLNPGFPVEVGDVVCSMRFSSKKTAHVAFSSAACRKSGKHDSMRLG
jgi:hypothetical protein